MSPLPYCLCTIALIVVGAFKNAGATSYVPPANQDFQKIMDTLQDVAKDVADSVLKVAEVLRSQQTTLSHLLSSTVHQPPQPVSNELAIQFGEYKNKFEAAEQQVKQLEERLLQVETTSSQAQEKSLNLESKLQFQQEEFANKSIADGEEINELRKHLLQVETTSSQAKEKSHNLESKVRLQQEELTNKCQANGEQIKRLTNRMMQVETTSSQAKEKFENNESKFQALEKKMDQAISKSHCRPPFDEVGYDCIYVNQEAKLSWHECRDFCRTLGGDLAVPSDVLKLREFLISLNTGQDYWIGGSDLKEEGSWLWLDGRKVDLSEHWANGEPNNGGGKEHCLHHWATTSLLFNDVSCTRDNTNCVCQDVIYPRKRW